MGLTAKDIQVYAWKFLKFSMETCYIFVKKYPSISSMLLVFFLLYMLFPFVFWLIICTSPVLIATVVIYRVYFCQNIKTVVEDGKKNVKIKKICSRRSRKPMLIEEDIFVDKRNRSLASSHFEAKNRGNVEEKSTYDNERARVEDKDTVFSTSYNTHTIDKRAVEEEMPKDIREVKVFAFDQAEPSSSSASQALRPDFQDGPDEWSRNLVDDKGKTATTTTTTTVMESDSSEEAEEEQENRKAFEWTADDQKNLMDLGVSEVERNKRLEGLIARRRARKMWSVQVRRTLMKMGKNSPPGPIASLLISRDIPSLSNSSSGHFPPTPGSAPSVLLPMHNPFDLPYDPHEEKPDLTGDSFHQEFMAAHMRDIMLCRHQSFSLGHFYPTSGEYRQDGNEILSSHKFVTKQKVPEVPTYFGSETLLGKEDDNQQTEHDSSQEDEPAYKINNTHGHSELEGEVSDGVFDLKGIHHDQDRGKQVDGKGVAGGLSSSSSSSESNGPIFRANKEAILKSLTYSLSKNRYMYEKDRIQALSYDCGSSLIEKTRTGSNFGTLRQWHHTPAHSIDSDMLVELSETSPPMTIDGNMSIPNEESSTYDGDMEKETILGSDGMSTSSQLSGADENESKSRELYHASGQDTKEVGFSGLNYESKNPPVQLLMPENEVERGFTHEFFPSPLNSELGSTTRAHSIKLHTEYQDNSQPPGTSPDASSPESLALLSADRMLQSIDKPEAHLYHEDGPEKPKEPTSSPIGNLNGDPELHEQNSAENLRMVQGICAGAHLLMNQENGSELSNLFEGALSMSSFGGPSENSGEVPSFVNSYEPADVFQKSNFFVDFGEKVIKKSDNKDRVECSTGEEGSRPFSTTQKRQGEKDISESGVSTSDLSLNYAAVASLPEPVIELVSTTSTLTSSPNSVPKNKALGNQASSSTSGQKVTVEVQHKPVDEAGLLDEWLPFNSTGDITLNSSYLDSDSITSHSNNRKVQEPCSAPEKSNRELYIICDVKEPRVHPDNDVENSDTGHNIDNVAHVLIKQQNALELVQTSGGNNSKETEDTGSPSEEPSENRKRLYSYEPLEENNCSIIFLDSERDPAILTENIDMVIHSTSVENPDILVRQGVQVPTGVGPSEVGQSVDEHQEPMAEQIPTSSSSPKSVLQLKFSMDLMSLSSFDQDVHLEGHDPETLIVEDMALLELPHENIAQAAPPNELHLIEDSAASYQSHREDSVTPQGSSIWIGKPTTEASSKCNEKEPVVMEEEEKGRLKSVVDSEIDQKRVDCGGELYNASRTKSTEHAGGKTEKLDDVKDATCPSIPIEKVEKGKPTAQASSKYDEKESVITEKGEKGRLKSVVDSEIEQKSVDCGVESSNASSSISTEHAEDKIKHSVDVKDATGPPKAIDVAENSGEKMKVVEFAGATRNRHAELPKKADVGSLDPSKPQEKKNDR